MRLHWLVTCSCGWTRECVSAGGSVSEYDLLDLLIETIDDPS
jgi:hypothetical protein